MSIRNSQTAIGRIINVSSSEVHVSFVPPAFGQWNHAVYHLTRPEHRDLIEVEGLQVNDSVLVQRDHGLRIVAAKRGS